MIKVTGIDQVKRNLSSWQADVVRRIYQASQIAQALVVNDAKNDHPYKDKTGNLTNSIQPGPIELRDNQVTAFVEARMQYATFVEFGTSRARAYPFLTTAVIRNQARYKKLLERATREARP